MDIVGIGIIGSLLGASVIAGINIVITMRNREFDLAIKRMENLYSPLHALIVEREKELLDLNKEDLKKKNEDLVVALKEIFFKHEGYASGALRDTMSRLVFGHGINEHGEKKDTTTKEEDLGEKLDKVIEMVRRDFNSLIETTNSMF